MNARVAQLAPAGERPGTLCSLSGDAARTFLSSDLVAGAILVNGCIYHATPMFRRLSGTGDCTGTSLLDCLPDEDRERVRALLDEPAHTGVATVECHFGALGGRVFPAELRLARGRLGSDPVLFILLADVSERVAADLKLRAAAHYDSLTGLANRVLLQDRLSIALATARRKNFMMALLVADLDGFKAVNDVHGHVVGDRVLCEVARRFSNCVRSADTLARVGGDEFVFVLTDIGRREDAALLASRLVNSLRGGVEIGGVRLDVGTSLGIAILPDDGVDMEALFARADEAMYASKQAGRNRYAYADASAVAVLRPGAFKWSADWKVGVADMDEEHEALFTMFDRLYQSIRTPRPPENFSAEIEAIVDFAVGHFASEERLMEAAGYPKLEAHRQEHRRLLGELSELAGHTHPVGATLTMRYLQGWLVGHMLSYDRAAAAGILAAAGKVSGTQKSPRRL